MTANPWPELPLESWQDSYATLHLWTQIVGKVRLACSPWVNHSWHVTLYVTPRGLTTGPIPHGQRVFQLDFDFRDHRLRITEGDGDRRELALVPRSVADFHGELLASLADLGLSVRIHGRPNELEQAIPFAEDRSPRSYQPERVAAWHQALLQADRVLRRFRAGYRGKCSPVHFFWGAFDLAVTRFSGRPAPEHPGGLPGLPDWITREAYSQEVSSCGFWPGGGPAPYPLFYAYAYPEPAGFADAALLPADAFYSRELGEFVLPYDAVRTASDPDALLLSFLQGAHDAAAELAAWDRSALEMPR